MREREREKEIERERLQMKKGIESGQVEQENRG